MHYKKIWFCVLCCTCAMAQVTAQDFVTRVKIEFEKKVNIQRSMQMQGDLPDELKDRIPKYMISYYNFMYAGGQSIYKLDHVKPNDKDENGFSFSFGSEHKDNQGLFIDYNNKQTVYSKNILDDVYIIKDSIKPVKWKVTNETRKIAGYECRKAIGRIYDTVYIVAFYAEELVMKAGPEAIQGLPGMILGMAIPRYNTTWFATKVELAKIDESAIIPPSKGKKITDAALTTLLVKQYKEMGIKDIKPEKILENVKGYFLGE